MSTQIRPDADETSGASFSHLASRMGDEGTFQLVEDSRPLRVSGFISLLLGILSPLTYFGIVLVVIPVAALAFGFKAIARYQNEKPVGYTAGQIGMLLALFFGLLGATVWGARRATLSHQAETYAMNFLDTLAQNLPEAALQLSVPYASRTEAPLVPYYRSTEDLEKVLNEMVQGGIYRPVQGLEGDTNWKISRPTKITRGFHGVEKAEVCLVDAEGRIDLEAQIFLDVNRDADGNLQWHVMHAQPYRELIVSTGNL